eukprot:3202340-Rhodomonas_salina.1
MRGVASIGMLAIYMVIALESLTLTVGGLLQICLSPALAWAVQHFVGQSRSVSKDLHVRVQWMLPRAAWAMFVTSFTSAAAFFSTCMSPLVSTCSFGIFAGTAVLVDYMLVVFLFIPMLVVYHKIFPSSGKKARTGWFSWTHVLTTTYRDIVSYVLGLVNVRLDSETAVDRLLPDDNNLQKAAHAYLTQFSNSTDTPIVHVSYSKGANFQEEACKSALWDMVGYLRHSTDAGTVQVVDQARGGEL